MNVSKNFITRDLKSLPTDWKWVKLGEVCERITKGGTPTTYGFKFQRSGVRFLKIENVKEGRVILDSITDFISEDAHEYQKKSQLSVGDILFSIAGTIGETCAVREEYLPANTNQAFAIIRGAQEHFNLKFLQFQLESFVAKIKIKARGGAMNNVSLEDLKNFESILPPKDVQHAIVSKIEELLSELDKGKRQLETAQQQLQLYRQAVLKWAFEGKLTNENVKEGELPKGWKISTIGETCDMKAGLFVKASEIEDEYKVGLFPCYGGNGLRGYTKSYTHEGTFSLVGRQGALCGNVHFVSGKFHATEHAVVTKAKTNIDIDWLFYKLTSMKLNQYSRGAAQPGLSVNKLLPIEVEVPQIKEQQLIVQEIERRLSVCDKVEETIVTSLQQAETLRQSILKRAFEGKLV